MGISYTEMGRGQLDGRQEALRSGKELWDYTRSKAFDAYKSAQDSPYDFAEFWIGFGLGYEDGLKLRRRLYDAVSDLPFEERLTCYAFVLKQQEYCGKDIATPYLEHTGHWGLLDNLPGDTCTKALSFLADNRLQPALLELESFYKDRFQLKAAIALYTMLGELSALRRLKVKDPGFNTAPGKALLANQLRNWIGENTMGRSKS
ncbi:hypothetical protein [Taibaiella chishuiensis]|uniref:Uncharacterized protein n=1 Tax=Taibaiella chishuiensis TaxID=1434707 RepID=A0A2P8D9X4_9BACT|nr:hypothetical protein [Taibaiella chishuiensis]PSK94028.1 hypothetical protein B0I18_101178 [Taibaiella chishuiensis]